ncbi:MAG TPA: murein L,D-transpeptidase catalytic domain family protein [Vicinamibacterales bacterium]|nr:murein L,D-transpeptidase catalytic domain family protein [Vicinamibacterales bacterium]
MIASLTALAMRPMAAAAEPRTADEWRREAWTRPAPATIDVQVLDRALGAASCASRAGLVDDPVSLTIIDYSRPSTEKRLWTFDLATGKLLHHELVAHGAGSGENLATAFSNVADSHQSSLGLFVTADTYTGRNGYSLRLDGLDDGFNDRARERAIVVHGAPYVSDEFARANGRLGRSWGCPALGDNVAREFIDRIKGGNLIFAYYPDQAWLNGSRLLGDCAAAAESKR